MRGDIPHTPGEGAQTPYPIPPCASLQVRGHIPHTTTHAPRVLAAAEAAGAGDGQYLAKYVQACRGITNAGTRTFLVLAADDHNLTVLISPLV